MVSECPECLRLSANLAEATKAYFQILEKSQLAQTGNDLALASALEAVKLRTSERRGKARQELRWHETTHAKAKSQTA